MRKLITFLVLGLVALAVAYFAYNNGQSDAGEDASISSPVKKGAFEVKVSATGELQAKQSEKILGPQGMRSVGIFQTTITEIVPEGTVVAEGGYVATLDRTELGNKMKSVATDIEKTESQLLQIKLDTAIEMRGLRDQLINLNYSKEEKRLEQDMNIYEAPAIQRQTKLELEKLDRDYLQSKTNYSLKQEQAQAKVQEITATLLQHQDQMAMMVALSSKFVVQAPKSGMVIYERSWNGKKGPGSRVTAWDPVVAQLPDLTDMISVTYVNEVDISKIKTNQEVDITIDAFPDKKYKGTVFSIANIGEQRPNFDAKVFEVKIQLSRSDSILRPAMTTANEVSTSTFKDVLFVPLEALHSNDSLSYVFTKMDKKLIKKEVMSGVSNDHEVILKEGVVEGEEVMLTIPNEADKIELQRLPADIRMAYERKKKEEQERQRKRAEEDKKKLEEMKAKYSKGVPGMKFGKK